MARYQVIKATGAPRVDLAENEPFRRVAIDTIVCTWDGHAENRREALAKATLTFIERGFMINR